MSPSPECCDCDDAGGLEEGSVDGGVGKGRAPVATTASALSVSLFIRPTIQRTIHTYSVRPERGEMIRYSRAPASSPPSCIRQPWRRQRCCASRSLIATRAKERRSGGRSAICSAAETPPIDHGTTTEGQTSASARARSIGDQRQQGRRRDALTGGRTEKGEQNVDAFGVLER